jgi:ribosomal protein S18 acetylase RimI-like enzyme
MEREIRIEAVGAESSAATVETVRELLLEYGRFVLEAEGPARFCFGKLEDEAKGLPGSYRAEGGELLLAWTKKNKQDAVTDMTEEVAAGCVSYRALKARAGGCEMKRLWVRPGYRGWGLGERLTQELLVRARAAGYEAVYLDTFPAAMGSAYGMYLRLGFEECEPYHESKTEGLVFMRRVLG